MEREHLPDQAGAGSEDAALIAAARREFEALRSAQRRGTSPTLPASPGSATPGSSAPGADWEAGPPTPSLPSGASLPDSFAGYQVLDRLQRGGQGVVYLAVQKSTHRKVAIKVMREGPFASPAEQARFDREIQVLGQLRHPNIVAIHDSGQVAGHHYFVMDYVGGQTLDAWMAHGPHTLEQTLRLGIKLCAAVHAAHLRGITHRDLKPSNIRVDEEGEPRILDFGLAKVELECSSAADTTFTMTQAGQFLGSLPWASPEQAAGDPRRIDLRTDVYALGVILYQMLTGRFPYSTQGTMPEVLERIQHAEPARLRAQRVADGPCSGRVDDDVETIVLRCLAKDPERRYQSADALGRDLAHYLAGEPIEARRESAAYVLRKYLRRHRGQTAVAAGFAVVILAGLATSLTFWRSAVVERGHADQARQVAEERRAAAEASEQRADAAAETARQQAAIAASANRLINDMLAKANRAREQGNPNITVREVMDTAAHELEAGTARYEPQVEAAVRMTIAGTYYELGLYRDAEQHARAALELRQGVAETSPAAIAESLDLLGRTLDAQGDAAHAEPLVREAVRLRRAALAPQHLDIAASLQTLGTMRMNAGDYTESAELLQEALAIARLHEADHPTDAAFVLMSLGILQRNQGDYTGAEAALREALDLELRSGPAGNTLRAAILTNLGAVLRYREDYREAEPHLRKALQLNSQLLGNEHPEVAGVLSHLSAVRRKRGDHREAEALLRSAIEIDRRALGPRHPSVAADLNNLAELARMRGEYSAAEPLYREALSILLDQLGPDHLDVAACQTNLGLLLSACDDFDDAEALLQAALATCRRRLGEEHWRVAVSLNNLGECYRLRGNYAAAGECYESALAIQRRLSEPQPQLVAATLTHQGQLWLAQQEYAAAEQVLREALAIAQRRSAPSATIEPLTGLGIALHQRACWDEAEATLLEAVEVSRNSPGWYFAPRRAAVVALIAMYEDRHVAEPRGGHDSSAAYWRAKLAQFDSGMQSTAPSPAGGQ